MKPRHRSLALRLGGAVITAGLLMLVERCAPEPPRRLANPPPSPAPHSDLAALKPAASAPAPHPAGSARPALPQPSARAEPARPVAAPDHPASGRHSGSLVDLIGSLTARSPHRIVAANDRVATAAQAAPAHPPAPAAEPRHRHHHAAPPPSLQELTQPRRPREPLLGVATRAPAPAPAVAATPAGSANDNPAVPDAAPPVASPAASPPIAAPTLATGADTAQPPQLPPPATPSAAPGAPSAIPAPAEPAPATTDMPPAPAVPAAPAAEPAAPISPTTAVDAPAAPVAPAKAAPLSRAGKGIAMPAPALTGFSDDDELILELTTPGHEIDETVIAYSRHGATYLPLGEIARILDLAVKVSDEGRYASGWALDPAKTLALNLREGTLVLAGQSRRLAPDDAVAFDGELYLRADRFGDIFPLTLTTNLRAQTITVQTRVPFPFQQRAARETAREQLRGRQARRDGPQFERIVAPWRAIDVPLIDTELRAASDSARGPRGEADLRMAGDFAWLTARSFMSLDSQSGITAARLELGRRDPDGGLLGPLKATEFGFGDITSAALPLGLASVSGRGLFVSNAPLEQASVFDKIELRGDMPDGYEAELYRNNILINTAASPQDGQYRFLNIPVEFGLNVFRVVLYGPQGQRREIVRQISVGDGRLSPGEFRYAASAVQRNQPLFALHGRDYLPGPDDGALRTAAEFQYGLSRGLTAALSGAVYDRLGQRHWLAGTGLRTGLAGFAFKLDLGLADQDGRAYGFGAARRLGGFSVTVSHTEYRGTFVDEVRSFSDQPLRRVTEVTINGALAPGGEGSALRIPINGIARVIRFADGHEIQSASLTQALPLSSRLQLSHLIELDRTRAPLFGSTTQLRGAFDLASLARASLQLRASLGYAVLPLALLTSAAVQVDRRISERATLSATAGRNFQAHQNLFGLSALRRFDRFALALEGNYTSHPDRYAVMLRLSFGLGRNPLDGRLFMAPGGLAGGGAVALHAFRDLDGDGRFEPGEPALGDVRFFAGSENRATDSHGQVLLARLGDGPRTSVRIDRDSLPDINLAPGADGIELAPRAGRIVVHDFPIRALGELDGTARIEAATGSRTLSGVIVLLLDPQRRIAGRTRTGADGTFWFEKLPAGSYQLALDPGQAARLGIELVDPQPVLIGPDGPSLRQNLIIRAVPEDILKTNA